MDLVFPAEQGCQVPEVLPVPESDTQLAHKRPQPFSIYALLPRWPTRTVSRFHHRWYRAVSGLPVIHPQSEMERSLIFFVSGLMVPERLTESAEQYDIRIVVAGAGKRELLTVFGPGIRSHE